MRRYISRRTILVSAYTLLDVFTALYISSMHCVKSVRIRSYFGPHFSRIFPQSAWIRSSPYSVRMRENAGKIQTRIIPNTDTFYAVTFQWIFSNILKLRPYQTSILESTVPKSTINQIWVCFGWVLCKLILPSTIFFRKLLKATRF